MKVKHYYLVYVLRKEVCKTNVAQTAQLKQSASCAKFTTAHYQDI